MNYVRDPSAVKMTSNAAYVSDKAALAALGVVLFALNPNGWSSSILRRSHPFSPRFLRYPAHCDMVVS